jgi:hypothetical protein
VSDDDGQNIVAGRIRQQLMVRDPFRGCDGQPCSVIRAWCPDCDRETDHTRISATCRECRECGELTADIVSVSG